MKKLSTEQQDMAGEVLLALAGMRESDHMLTPEQIDDLRVAVAQADRREFATDEQIASAWRKFGLRGCGLLRRPSAPRHNDFDRLSPVGNLRWSFRGGA